MSESPSATTFVLDPADEYCHAPDAASNFNESMYFNAFDPTCGVGGWFRLGNRVHEGHAEMSCCVYLPDGRVGFMFQRPPIASNAELNAGGMRIEVVEPFARLRVTYEGTVCLLARPAAMADPSRAFRENPLVPCAIALDYTAIAPVWGGRPVGGDGAERDAERSFAKAHYEQHMAVAGTIAVGDERFAIAGFGLRDKSWGPRYWQAIRWYRWLPISFGRDFGMMISVIDDGARVREGGMVLRAGAYVPIRAARVESEWDAEGCQTSLRAVARTDERDYEVHGRVLSLLPLRNRRTAPDGSVLHTRITEGMTEYRCDGRVGWGLSEYLDQVVDGRPVGPDVRLPAPPAR